MIIRILILAAVLLTGCGQVKKAEQFQALPFPEVHIPEMMTDPSDRAEYSSLHFWDEFVSVERSYPCDSILVSGVKKIDVEQKFANWISVLDMVSAEIADKSIGRLYEKAAACEKRDSSSNLFETFTEFSYKYLYNPNSPMRNEEYYHSFVRRLASFDGLDDVMRGKYSFEARMTGLNRIGTIASDFRFADKNGRIGTLHGIIAPFTLLFFSNPGCEACMNIIEVLKGEPRISGLIEEGRLAVLNMYIDEDIQSWRDYMPVYPDEWYNGFDPDLVIRNDNLYNVRAIPSLYLLDEEKRVILKDTPENRLFDLLLSL